MNKSLLALCATLPLCVQTFAMEKKSASDALVNQNIKADVPKVSAPPCFTEGPFFSVDFLYWQAKEDDLEYVQKDKFKSRGNPFLVKSKLEDLDFDWDPGARVAIGYTFPRDQWDLSLIWTYLHSRANDSTHTNDPELTSENLRPNWIPVLLGSISDHASAHWRMNYNILDLELGKSYFIAHWLSLRPHVDLRGVWIHQDYNLRYHGGFQFLDGATLTTLFKNTSFKAENNFSAIGFVLGCDSEWYLSRHWSILAKISASLDYGKFRVREKINGGFLNSDGVTVFINNEKINFKENFWRLRPSLDTELGVQWQTLFHCDKYRVAAYATYNFVYWPDQNQLINSIVARDSFPLGDGLTNLNANVINFHEQGNLQLQGVKIGMRFDF